MPCEPQGGARCLGGVVFLRRDTRGARAPTHQHHVSHTLARERRRCSPESTALATGRAHKPAKGDRPVGGRVARGPRGKGRWPATLAGRLSPPPGPVGGKEPPELVCGRRLGKPCRKGWPCQYRHTTPHRVNRSWLHMLHTQGGVSVLFRRGWGQKSASPAAEPASWLRGARPRHWGQKSAGGLAGTRDGPHSKCQGGCPRAARSVMARQKVTRGERPTRRARQPKRGYAAGWGRRAVGVQRGGGGGRGAVGATRHTAGSNAPYRGGGPSAKR